jgi:hypothetical protein
MTAPSRPTNPITTEQRVARLFGLEGDRWMRHANPWSVWTRFSVLSLIALAIWSRVWIGWYSIALIALALAWMMLNPLFFPAPRSTRNWASRSVLGERVWSNRTAIDIPPQFRSPVPNVANCYAVLGILLLAYGLVTLGVLPTIAGLLIAHGGKLWYLDRMVLLFDDVKARRPDIAAWEY